MPSKRVSGEHGEQGKMLYAADEPTGLTAIVGHALAGTVTRFEEVRQIDSRLVKPIINRDLIAVTVALKPGFSGPKEHEVLTITQIGEIDKPDLFELFVLKATYRAFAQRRMGQQTDIAPMEKLSRLRDGELHKASSASVNGLHVGFAGGWAHHGRLLAVEFAADLSASLGLSVATPDGQQLLGEVDAQARLAWLNQGQNSGDNTSAHAAEREQYRFIFDHLSQ
jgi:hypothetical protein